MTTPATMTLYDGGTRCAGGAAQSAGGAEIVPRQLRHQRPSGAGRPWQRRLAGPAFIFVCG
jgi:hypothetical protein